MNEYFDLQDYPRFILWNVFDDPKRGLVKRAIDWRTGYWCDFRDSQFHTDYQTAKMASLEGVGGHVGFVICEEDPFFFIDIDDARDGDGWRPECQAIIDRFPGAFVETSQSGNGIHIIGSCDKTALPQNRRKMSFDFDTSFDGVFTERRFVALTDYDASGDFRTVLTAELAEFIQERLFLDGKNQTVDWNDEPREGPGLSDPDVISKALKSMSTNSAFGKTAPFSALWIRDEEVLGHFFPDAHNNRSFDASRADMALAQHLAFWCAGNCEQMLRIMNMSELRREKWDARGDYYMHRTVLSAVSRQDGRYYTGVKLSLLPPPPPDDVEDDDDDPPEYTMPEIMMNEGSPEMTAREQMEYFRGCVYVATAGKVLTSDGEMLSVDAFKAMYGGYRFEIDKDKKTEDAHRAFTQSRLLRTPKVMGLMFNPTLPFQAIVDNKVNTYMPVNIESKEGDVSLFLEHMALLLPVEADRIILIDYMAACVQRPGDKFQWAPMIQGVEGNGKSLIATIMRNAVGQRYYHQQDPDDLKNTFNAWIENHIVVCVEEIFTNDRHELSNRMKAMITNSWTPIHPKTKDQRSGSNCAKFVLFSNHKDGVSKHRDDRRYAIFYTAQQERKDKLACGMDGKYFSRLYGWAGSREGRAALRWYLEHREIVTDMMTEAPETSSTREAIFESQTPAARVLYEAIESEEIGLRGGILSATYVDYALREAGWKLVNPKLRGKLLRELGYKSAGRIRIGDKIHRLYVGSDSPLANESTQTLKKIYVRKNHSASDEKL